MVRTVSASVVMILAVATLTGCVRAAGPRQLRSVADTEPSSVSDWARVLALPPAATVLLTVRGSEPQLRWIARADDATLIVIDFSDQAIRGRAGRVLRRMAKDHSESFVVMAKGGTFEQENVRIGRDGVFVGERQVAGVNQVVETIARDAVIEIRGPVVARGSVFGAVLGVWLGFSAGVVPALAGAPLGVAWSALVAATAGGGYLGSHWSSHHTKGLVYRAGLAGSYSTPPLTVR